MLMNRFHTLSGPDMHITIYSPVANHKNKIQIKILKFESIVYFIDENLESLNCARDKYLAEDPC